MGKMSVYRKRILGILLALALIGLGVYVYSISAVASNSENLNQYLTAQSTVQINGTTVTPGSQTTGKYGDTVTIGLKWTFPNSITVKNGDSFTYTLPSNVYFTEDSGILKDDVTDEEIGKYTVSGNTVTVTYTSDQKSNATGHLTLDGKITSSSMGGNDGGEIKFDLGTSTYDISVPRDSSHDGVRVVKGDATAVSGKSDQRGFVLKVVSVGSNSSVKVSDEMGADLSLVSGSIGVYTDAACTTEYTGSYSTSSGAFPLTINSMTDGQTLYIGYKVSIAKAAYADSSFNWSDKGKNTASVTSKEDTTANTSSKYVTVNTVSTSKWGSVTGNDVTWTIQIMNKDNVDLKGTTVKDVPGSDLSTPGDVTVQESSDGNSWSDSSLSISWSQLASGTYTFPENSTRSYRIIYKTTAQGVPAIGTKNVSNKVIVTPWGDSSYQQTSEPGAQVGTDAELITKNCDPTRGTGSATTINWETIVKVPSGSTLTKPLITDTLGTGQTMVNGSIKLYSDSACTKEYTGDYTLTSTGAGFTIQFNGTLDGGTYVYVKYQSKITTTEFTQSYTTFTNHVNLTAQGGITQDKDASYYYVTTHQWLSKDCDYSNSGNGKITWDLNIALDGTENLDGTTGAVMINDQLPANTKLITGNLHAYDRNGSEVSGVTVTEGSDGKITFSVGGAALKSLAENYGLKITYGTQITDISKITQGTSTEFTNKAQMTVNNVNGNEASADYWYKANDIVSKTSDYSTTTAPYAKYTIKINPAAIDLDPYSDSLSLTDSMGSALDIVDNSITVTTADGKYTDKAIADLAAAGYSYGLDKDGNITLTVPDDTAITLNYKAKVNLAAGSTLDSSNASNTVTLKGSDSNNKSSTTTLGGKVLESKAGGSSDSITLDICKYGNSQKSVVLSGAKFKVEELTVAMSSDNKAWTSTAATPTNSDGYTTLENGIAEVTPLSYDRIYKVTETEAPSGYAISTEPQYFIFCGNDSSKYDNYENVTIDGKNLTVIAAGTISKKISFVDELKKTDVTLSKVGMTGSAELKDADLKIVKGSSADGTEVTSWTSGDTAKTISLEAGTYTMVETTAPTNYKTAESITFTVESNGTVTIDGKVQDGNKVVMRDSLNTTSATFSKKAVNGSDELAGAELTVTDSAGNTVDSWTSGKEAHSISGLQYGQTYKMTETTAPANYTKAEDITFTINSDGQVVIGDKVQDGNNVVMRDSLNTTSATFSKKVVNGTDELAGAKLAVTDSAGNTVDSWTSGKEAHSISGLVYGQTYKMTEITAPANYDKAEDITFTIDSAGKVVIGDKVQDGNNVVMRDSVSTTTVSFSKKAVNGTDELAGAELAVKDLSGTTIDSWTSGTEAHSISGLLYGQTYTMTEVKSPAGYDTAEDITFRINEAGKVEIQNGSEWSQQSENKVQMQDAVTMVPVTLSKVGMTGSAELKDADLKIVKGSSADGTEVTSWTSGDTAKTISLEAGTYTMVETTAPTNYKTAESITFTVESNGTVTIDGKALDGNKVIMKDILNTTSATFSKKAVNGSDELAGAKLTVTDSAGNAVDSWTSGKEVHSINGLQYGQTYKMTETTAPANYTKAEDITFTINSSGQVVIGDKVQDGNNVVMRDSLNTTSATFSKKAVNGSDELAGAKLTVTDAAGKTVDSWTSGKEAHSISGLVYGQTYKMTETTAPANYTKAEDITFTIDSAGKVVIGDKVQDGNNVVMRDSLNTTSATFSKKAVNGSDELAGAKLTVTDAKGNTVDSWTSGKEAHSISGLQYGQTYKMTETTAPANYTKAEDITFTINSSGQVVVGDKVQDGNNVVMRDSLNTTSATFSKKVVNGTDELAGAKLAVTDSAGNTVDSWTSGKEAHSISGLVYGQTYKMTEITAPTNYDKAEDITFTIDSNGQVIVNGKAQDGNNVVMRDSVSTTTVSFSKTAVNGTKELAGAELAVKDSSDNIVDSWTSGTEAHSISGLQYGQTYTMVENASPAGYDKTSSITFRINEKGKVELQNGSEWSQQSENKVQMQDEVTKIPVTFSKTEVNGTSELAGASLTVRNNNDSSEVYSWTSTSETRQLTLKEGNEYTMTETAAPSGYDKAESIVFRVTTEGTVEIKNGDNWLTQSENKVQMQDSRTPIEKISKTVKKVWKDSNNKYKERPGSVKVRLYANGKAYGAAVTLSAGNKWTYTWKDLPATTEDRTAISYNVEEISSVSGYQPTYSADGSTITNTIIKGHGSRHNTPGHNGTTSKTNGGGSHPRTGDQNLIMLYLALMAASAGLVMTLKKLHSYKE
jgi:uncharacterized surface anchored protein